jgi:hypothetical protein
MGTPDDNGGAAASAIPSRGRRTRTVLGVAVGISLALGVGVFVPRTPTWATRGGWVMGGAISGASGAAKVSDIAFDIFWVVSSDPIFLGVRSLELV